MVETCIHVANVMYLISYLVWDMLWLRVLTCIGLVLGIAFFSCQPTPLYGPTLWQAAFLVINVVQIRRLMIERRQLRLTEEQEIVGEVTFQDLSREELLTLLAHVMCEKPRRLADIPKMSRQPLTNEQRVLRDIAFSRLSRAELLNLLTRRLWHSVLRLNPIRWKRKRSHEPEIVPDKPEVDVAQSSVAG